MAAVTSGCPSLPGPMPALFCKASRDRSVSGPMLGIVLQSCRSPQCFGCASIFPAAFRLPPGSPAGEIARPTIQGKRQAKPGTECSRQRPFFRHPFVENCRAGVHARRGDFRLPQPSRSNARFVPQIFRLAQRFRADEITAARRQRFGGSPARSAGVRAGARPLRSTTRQAPALHRPAELPAGRKVPRRAKSSALHGEANGKKNREQNIRGSVHFSGTHLWRIVGRGVHARRGDFRLPQPSRSNARFVPQIFRLARRFRADENHRPLRKRSGDPQSFRLVLYCPPPDF